VLTCRKTPINQSIIHSFIHSFVVYIDFNEAFDSIVFSKFLYKLQNCAISGNLLAGLSSFAHARSQCVVLENCFSAESDVLSGVPHGSDLGPILFLIFINDVISICSGNTTVKLFADDLELFSVYSASDNSSNLRQSINLLTGLNCGNSKST